MNLSSHVAERAVEARQILNQRTTVILKYSWDKDQDESKSLDTSRHRAGQFRVGRTAAQDLLFGITHSLCLLAFSLSDSSRQIAAGSP